MLRWLQGGLSTLTGIAEPEYGKDYISSCTQRVRQKKEQPFKPIDKSDLNWLRPNHTNVETVTFYFSELESGIVGFAQIIHSNVIGLHITAQFTFRIFDCNNPDKLNIWTSTKLENFVIDGANFYADDLSLELNEELNQYHFKSSVNKNSEISLYCTRLAPGCKLGDDPMTYFGDNIEEPWGTMRHIFWPRNHITGKIILRNLDDTNKAKGNKSNNTDNDDNSSNFSKYSSNYSSFSKIKTNSTSNSKNPSRNVSANASRVPTNTADQDLVAGNVSQDQSQIDIDINGTQDGIEQQGDEDEDDEDEDDEDDDEYMSESEDYEYELVFEFTDENPAMSLFIMACQGMKPHHAARSWNFLSFHAKKNSCVYMEFTTPRSYANTVVSIGIIANNDEILSMTIDNKYNHLNASIDDIGWSVPKNIQLEFNGFPSNMTDSEVADAITKLQNDYIKSSTPSSPTIDTPTNSHTTEIISHRKSKNNKPNDENEITITNVPKKSTNENSPIDSILSNENSLQIHKNLSNDKDSYGINISKLPFKAKVDANLVTMVERVDVMNEIPQFVKNIVSGVVGTKPYIYQFSDNKNFYLQVEGQEKEVGFGWAEVTFISEIDAILENATDDKDEVRH
ncbi:hypothetical protein TBLA_0A03520 [Henningerozyma blattae CBS 6284]|uniref:Uncharacterized protein n=1 Tax=Henningerozyma blattae (strain ATCC 34711 / CBS 6284 / DSM 70876 / NBRC 10599 / NRRL Y-10934 / UCD 77-7) TaxID=1071380 RepID=I2GVJ9_HENB6|nr:hypothetical protein TBLA_0A03520 [Tetrapisispora blattae CBS 6284]CCH58151.1 hypothetical protein TBLA_0A03520 [Tetrapisispora blattae CBS 6284]